MLLIRVLRGAVRDLKARIAETVFNGMRIYSNRPRTKLLHETPGPKPHQVTKASIPKSNIFPRPSAGSAPALATENSDCRQGWTLK